MKRKAEATKEKLKKTLNQANTIKKNKEREKEKSSKVKDPYAEWKCPKCGSYETRKRYGRKYGDMDLMSGKKPEFVGDYYMLICNDCGTQTPITEKKYNKMQLKNYKQK